MDGALSEIRTHLQIRQCLAECLGVFVLLFLTQGSVAQAVTSEENKGNFFTMFLASSLAVTIAIYVAGNVSGSGHLDADCGAVSYPRQTDKGVPAGLEPVVVGLLALTIGLSMGVNCGFPLNPAWDLGPQLFTYFVGWGPEVFSAGNGWWWVSVVAPMVRATLGTATYQLLVALHHPEDPEPVPKGLNSGPGQMLCLGGYLSSGYQLPDSQRLPYMPKTLPARRFSERGTRVRGRGCLPAPCVPPKGRGKRQSHLPSFSNQAEKLRHKPTPRQRGAVPLEEGERPGDEPGRGGKQSRPGLDKRAKELLHLFSHIRLHPQQHSPGLRFPNKESASQRPQPHGMPACPAQERGTLPYAPTWRTPRPSPPQSPSRPPPAAAAVTSAPRPKLTQSSGSGPGWGEPGCRWGAGACGQRSRAPPPQPPAWAGRGRRAERRAPRAKVRRRCGAGMWSGQAGSGRPGLRCHGGRLREAPQDGESGSPCAG
ncbi:Aquaporin-10 [Sigmodon hispidus]